MNKLLILFLVIPFCGYGQFFTGEIKYETRIIPKSDTVDLQQIIEEEESTTSSYIINVKQYKTTQFKNGQFIYSYTYDNETKRMYDDNVDQPYLTYRDATKSNFKYDDSQMYKDSTATILGYNTYMTVLESEYGISKTYFSDELKIDYEGYEGHEVGDWYNQLKAHDGAMSLRTITEHDLYFKVTEAVKVKKRKVKAKQFKLSDKPIAASFTALDQKVSLDQPSEEQIKCYQEKVLAASSSEGEKYTVYVSFLLEKDGTMKFIDTLEKGDDKLFKDAIDIVKSCGLTFTPGKIGKETVDSQVFFPIEFLR